MGQQHAALEKGNGRAVFGCDVEDVVGGGDRIARRHVLHNEDRVAWYMVAHPASNQPRIGVVSAPGSEADHDLNCLALIKWRLRGRWLCNP